MKVLVHFDSTGVEPYGLWWEDEDGVHNLYTNPDSPQATRGRALVMSKMNPEMGWGVFFDLLTERVPYFEVWATYDSMGMKPEHLLESL